MIVPEAETWGAGQLGAIQVLDRKVALEDRGTCSLAKTATPDQCPTVSMAATCRALTDFSGETNSKVEDGSTEFQTTIESNIRQVIIKK